MKRVWIIGLCLALVLVGSAFAQESRTIPALPDTPPEGAASYGGYMDHAGSPYYSQIDYFTAQSSGTLVLLSGFRTFQQTTESTCGPASALMAMDYVGGPEATAAYDDRALAALKGSVEGWTTLRQMQTIFDNLGWVYESTLTLELDPDTLDPTCLYSYIDQGIPVCVGWMEWGGHWTVLIGYDTMGTDDYYDDVLIMADPYDTFDHLQDGYTVAPADNFLYLWNLAREGDAEDEIYCPFLAVLGPAQAR